MHISLESNHPHAIQAYSEQAITINNITYNHNLIVSPEQLIESWMIELGRLCDAKPLQPLLELKPDILLIGHTAPHWHCPNAIRNELAALGIGIECMSLGSACRTFNILLSEKRNVVFGVQLEPRSA